MNWSIIFSGKRKQKKQIISVHHFYSVATFSMPHIVLHIFLLFFPVLSFMLPLFSCLLSFFFICFPHGANYLPLLLRTIKKERKMVSELCAHPEVSFKSEPSEAFDLLQFTRAVTDLCIWWMPTTHSPKYQHHVNLVAVDGRNLVLVMWFLAEEGLAREKTPGRGWGALSPAFLLFLLCYEIQSFQQLCVMVCNSEQSECWEDVSGEE